MDHLERRLELLKMEGLGFSTSEIVKQLSEKYQCSARAVYYDFEYKPKWQPPLLQFKDSEKTLMKIINRFEQIYRNASIKWLTSKDDNVQIRALHVMLKANTQLSETLVLPELLHDLEKIKEKVGI